VPSPRPFEAHELNRASRAADRATFFETSVLWMPPTHPSSRAARCGRVASPKSRRRRRSGGSGASLVYKRPRAKPSRCRGRHRGCVGAGEGRHRPEGAHPSRVAGSRAVGFCDSRRGPLRFPPAQRLRVPGIHITTMVASGWRRSRRHRPVGSDSTSTGRRRTTYSWRALSGMRPTARKLSAPCSVSALDSTCRAQRRGA
jgi:hypothetical protein